MTKEQKFAKFLVATMGLPHIRNLYDCMSNAVYGNPSESMDMPDLVTYLAIELKLPKPEIK